MKQKTAFLLIIGDEILSGRTQDTNSHFMARRLTEIGVGVVGISVIPDHLETIVKSVQQWSPRCNYLFTSGGIGPTHDDITREAVATATGRPLVLHGPTEKILREHYGSHINQARLSMALLPEGAEPIANPISAAPGFICSNVHVLPGIPEILEIMFESIIDRLEGSTIFSHEIPTPLLEGAFADRLREIDLRHPQVHIGSYPRLGDPLVRSLITIRSSCPELAMQVKNELEDVLSEILHQDSKFRRG